MHVRRDRIHTENSDDVLIMRHIIAEKLNVYVEDVMEHDSECIFVVFIGRKEYYVALDLTPKGYVISTLSEGESDG